MIQAVGFWKVGVRLPLLQGVTFTAVAPMISIGKANGGGVDGLLAIYGAVIVAGVVTFFAAPYFSRLLRLFPPVVTGTVITVIGITLLPVAAQQAGGGEPGRRRLRLLPEHRARRRRRCSSSSCCSGCSAGASWPPSPCCSGLVFGTVVAAIFGIVDFGGVSATRSRSASPRRSTSACRRSASPRSSRC